MNSRQVRAHPAVLAYLSKRCPMFVKAYLADGEYNGCDLGEIVGCAECTILVNSVLAGLADFPAFRAAMRRLDSHLGDHEI